VRSDQVDKVIEAISGRPRRQIADGQGETVQWGPDSINPRRMLADRCARTSNSVSPMWLSELLSYV
jgi:hypothetical protein